MPVWSKFKSKNYINSNIYKIIADNQSAKLVYISAEVKVSSAGFLEPFHRQIYISVRVGSKCWGRCRGLRPWFCGWRWRLEVIRFPGVTVQ